MIRSSRDGSEVTPSERTVSPTLEAPRDGVKQHTNIVTNPDRTTVVDNTMVPFNHLLQFANGSPWAVTWYRRLGGKNDVKGFYDPSVVNATQQLERINGLVLKVNSPMNVQQDTGTKSFSREGTATVVMSIPPNDFDFFVADLGNGRWGLFNTQDSQRLSDNKVSVYNISFKILYDTTPAIQEGLDKSTVREYYYVPDRAFVGMEPLLTPDEYQRFTSSTTYLKIIEESYVRRFFDRTIRSLAFPGAGPGERYYDVYLAQFVRTLGLRHVPDDIRIYPHTPMKVEDVFTLWKLLEQRSPWMLGDVEQKGGWYDKKTYSSRHGMNTVAYSHVSASFGFEDTINVNDFTSGVISEWPWPTAIAFEPQPIAYRGVEGEILPAYLPLSQGASYVLSEAFYQGSYASGLEYGLYCFINQHPTPSLLATQLAELLVSLPMAEQFYYTPLVYVLLNYTR